MRKEIRQLAAIMFADMVGYTAMMQENEQRTKELRDRFRAVLDEANLEFHGIILQHYGDGTLVMFGSAVDAVRCAVRIQSAMQSEPVIPLRIGLHVGDIAYDDEGIYGDSVNIASRIESLSVAGAVLLSDKVHDEIRNHPELSVRSMGAFKFKNVTRPIEVYAIDSDAVIMPDPGQLKSVKAVSVRSVAVLPFVNMSTDPENEYFSDGITEEIINALVKVPDLRVTSRTSSFVFKDQNQDIREIGKQLGVQTVLEGSVRKAMNRVRVTAQLINTADGYHVFSEVYDRELQDIFGVQDELSMKIAGLVQDSFKDSDQSLVRTSTQNMEAYNLYLKGVHLWNQWAPGSVKQGIRLFQRALELEPDFALAYSGIASTYTYLGAIGHIKPQEAFTHAREAAERALQLDDELAESHVAIGTVRLFNDWDWDGARRSFDRAVSISPGSALVHQSYSLYHIAMGNSEDTRRVLELASELDPLSPSISNALAYGYIINQMPDMAEAQYRKILDMDPNYRGSYEGLGWTELYRGNVDRAVEYFRKFQSMTSHETHGQSGLGYALAMAGRFDEARECLRLTQLREKLEPQVSLEMDYVVLYTALGDMDRAFEKLEEAIDIRLGSLIFIRANPAWSRLHDDPRFDEAIARMGLPALSRNEKELICPPMNADDQ